MRRCSNIAREERKTGETGKGDGRENKIETNNPCSSRPRAESVNLSPVRPPPGKLLASVRFDKKSSRKCSSSSSRWWFRFHSTFVFPCARVWVCLCVGAGGWRVAGGKHRFSLANDIQQPAGSTCRAVASSPIRGQQNYLRSARTQGAPRAGGWLIGANESLLSRVPMVRSALRSSVQPPSPWTRGSILVALDDVTANEKEGREWLNEK
ncbi:hypothetical protein ZHAS_00005440 [Anopheles sinensis]|uniref:Uncharacterized protein n=1 Tax=Anopheles sinensis TaxID=74873 RepID=A0A084VJK2_ANOSI|nr:hypothetical protein ZHAS_00005440 [Anopheles sinensis]